MSGGGGTERDENSLVLSLPNTCPCPACAGFWGLRSRPNQPQPPGSFQWGEVGSDLHHSNHQCLGLWAAAHEERQDYVYFLSTPRLWLRPRLAPWR